MKASLTVLARWVLGLSVAAILFLTFVWPFAVSADPADGRFRIAAVATFVAFLGAIVLLAVERLRAPERPRN